MRKLKGTLLVNTDILLSHSVEKTNPSKTTGAKRGRGNFYVYVPQFKVYLVAAVSTLSMNYTKCFLVSNTELLEQFTFKTDSNDNRIVSKTNNSPHRINITRCLAGLEHDGCGPALVADHINGFVWDNRDKNIRAITQLENRHNIHLASYDDIRIDTEEDLIELLNQLEAGYDAEYIRDANKVFQTLAELQEAIN